MILAAAQTKPKRWNIKANLADHLNFTEIASDNGADLIVFPELSITGYEREGASNLAFSKDDSRLDSLRKISVDKKIVILAGAPIKIDSQLFIGQFIIFPDGTLSFYTKQYLHSGESDYYSSTFKFNPIIQLNDEKISLAICADIDNPLHPEQAFKNGITTYIASIFFTPNGIPEAHEMLKTYAKKYSLNILMSNFTGESWGMEAGGKSAFWNNNGELIAELDERNNGMLIIEETNDRWICKTISKKRNIRIMNIINMGREINSVYKEEYRSVTSDCKYLFFNSNRP